MTHIQDLEQCGKLHFFSFHFQVIILIDLSQDNRRSLGRKQSLVFFVSTSLPIIWISFLDLQLQEILLCFPQPNPHGNKLARLPINCDAYLAYGIVKNAISGKDPLNPRELCNPFNLEFSCATSFVFQVKHKATNQHLTMYEANQSSWWPFFTTWESWHVNYHSNQAMH
jgi:hypothetical protein